MGWDGWQKIEEENKQKKAIIHKKYIWNIRWVLWGKIKQEREVLACWRKMLLNLLVRIYSLSERMIFEQVPKGKKEICKYVGNECSWQRPWCEDVWGIKKRQRRTEKKIRGWKMIRVEIEEGLVSHWNRLPQKEVRKHWRVCAEKNIFNSISRSSHEDTLHGAWKINEKRIMEMRKVQEAGILWLLYVWMCCMCTCMGESLSYEY